MMVTNKLKNFLDPYKSVSIAPLVIFRIIFGALMTFGIIRFVAKGWVEQMYIMPKFYFGYLGFEWVKPLPGEWMYLPFGLMILAAVGITIGAFYRYSTIIFFVCFSYVELLDKSNYLNHYYFISLVAFLMIWVPAASAYSFDTTIRKKPILEKVPAWTIGIIKFQLACVYVFAGIAKLESDWLFEAQPLKIWLQAHRDMPVFGNLLTKSWVAFFFSWFGCIYDLFIAFFLLNKKTRPFAYTTVIIFHFVTWYLLPIGIFPWVMIFSTLIFFSAEFHQKILNYISKLVNFKKALSPQTFHTPKYVNVLLVLFIFIQLLVPFRYLLSPGNLFWHEEGFRFSWRVMLMHKEGTATFFVRDKNSGGEIEIDNTRYLAPIQIDQMATQPDMILQYAQYLKQEFKDTVLVYGEDSIQLKDPSIHAQIYVSLNGRPSQAFVQKKHDLSSIQYDFSHRNWLEPFKP